MRAGERRSSGTFKKKKRIKYNTIMKRVCELLRVSDGKRTVTRTRICNQIVFHEFSSSKRTHNINWGLKKRQGEA